MAAQGVELLAELDELAVMGFAEVVPRLEQFRDLLRRVDEALLTIDLVILIDFPGFNMRVAQAASGRDRPVLYYVVDEPAERILTPVVAGQFTDHEVVGAPIDDVLARSSEF